MTEQTYLVLDADDDGQVAALEECIARVLEAGEKVERLVKGVPNVPRRFLVHANGSATTDADSARDPAARVACRSGREHW